MNFIGSWLAENGSNRALVSNIGSVIALVSVFRQLSESLKAYIYVMYLEILSNYGSTSGPLIRCGIVLHVFRRVRPLIDCTITDKSRAD